MRNPIPPPDEEEATRKFRAARRRVNRRLARTCDRCGATFNNLSDKLIHVSIECPKRGQPRLRAVSCHRCARDIDVNITRTCECGFTLPES